MQQEERGGGGLEEVVRANSIPRLLVFHENPVELCKIENFLKSGNVAYHVASSPDEVYSLAKDPNISSLLLGVDDSSNSTLDIAKTIYNERPKLYVCMIGDSSQYRLSQSFNAFRYVQMWFDNPQELDGLIDSIRVLERDNKGRGARFPRVYVVTGASGSGKSSAAASLHKKIDNLSVFVSATERPQREGEDADSGGLYKRIEHEFLSHSEMDEEIHDALTPFVYHFAGYRYLLDLQKVFDAYESGQDCIVIVNPAYAAKQLSKDFFKLFNIKPHVIYLRVDPKNAEQRMQQEGRQRDEKRLEALVTQDPEYMSIAHTIIDTQKSFSPNIGLNKIRSISHISGMIERLIKFRDYNEHQHGNPSNIHYKYARAIETTLLGRPQKARKIEKILVPTLYQNAYLKKLKGFGFSVEAMDLVPIVSDLTITGQGNDGNYLFLHVTPSSFASLSRSPIDEAYRNSCRQMTSDLIQTFLSFSVIDEPYISDPRMVYGFGPLPTTLLYSLTDVRPQTLKKGLHYGVAVIID